MTPTNCSVKYSIYIIFIISIFYSFVACGYTETGGSMEFKNNQITIVAEIDSPGFFQHNSAYYGYMFGILQDYARVHNIGIDVLLASSDSQIADSLNSGVADIGLSIQLPADENELKWVDIVDCEKYVIVSKKYTEPISLDSLILQMRGKSVAITNAVSDTKFYKQYSNPKYGINFVLNTTDLSRAVARKLAFNKVDYLICSKTNSAVFGYVFKDFNKICELDNVSCSSFYIARDNTLLYNDFSKWYSEEYVGSEAEKYNKNTYLTNKYMREFIDNGYLLPYKSASPFDYKFKDVAKKYDINWILLSSIADSESRFNSNLISYRGAVGLMQIMPYVAKGYGFDVDSLKNIKYNINVSGYILNDIRRMLSYSNNDLTNNNLSIMLACYNGGIGHINDARRLTRSEGKSSNIWSNVEESLKKLSIDSIYNNKKIVKFGKFHSGQTIYYVNTVMQRYERLKSELGINTLENRPQTVNKNK